MNEVNKNMEVIMAVFNGEDTADEVIKQMKHSTSSISQLLEQPTIITMDDKGKVSVAGDHKKRKGTLSGSAVGLLLGALVGVPVAGVVLGAVVGRFSVMKWEKDKLKKTGEDGLQYLVDQMEPDSSMIVAEVEDWRAEEVSDSMEIKGALAVLHISAAELLATPDSEAED